MPERPVPVIAVLADALWLASRNLPEFSRALGFPTLLLVAIWSVELVFVTEPGWPAVFLFWALYILGFSIFAITCHRLILMPSVRSEFGFTVRERKFALLLAVLSVLFFLGKWLILTVLINLPWARDWFLLSQNFEILMALSSIPMFYFLARFSLVFPATAVDAEIGLRDSWSRTRGNGWRVAIVIGLYPWLGDALLQLLERDEPLLVEQVAVGLLWYVILALEIFTLSVTYRHLAGTGRQKSMYIC